MVFPPDHAAASTRELQPFCPSLAFASFESIGKVRLDAWVNGCNQILPVAKRFPEKLRCLDLKGSRIEHLVMVCAEFALIAGTEGTTGRQPAEKI
jgi:hypothetical protein